MRIGSTPTFLYFDLYIYSAHAAHYVYYIYICFSLETVLERIPWLKLFTIINMTAHELSRFCRCWRNAVCQHKVFVTGAESHRCSIMRRCGDGGAVTRVTRGWGIKRKRCMTRSLITRIWITQEWGGACGAREEDKSRDTKSFDQNHFTLPEWTFTDRHASFLCSPF